MQDPVTPTTSSIRDFISRTSVPSTTLASTYRRNSKFPQTPSPLSNSASFTDSTISNDSFWSHQDHTASLTDIAIHLESNAKTPTKAFRNVTAAGYATPLAKIKAEVERDLDEFTPLVLPSSVTVTRKRNRNARSISPENARRKLGKEEFPSLSSSARQMPDHPAYDVSADGNKPIFKLHRQGETCKKEAESRCKQSSILKKEDTPMELDISPSISSSPFSDDNKENVDPTTFVASSLQTIETFSTPPHPDSRHVLYTPVKETLSRKKFEGMKDKSEKLRDSSPSASPFAITPRSDLDQPMAWSTPDGKREDLKSFQDRDESMTLPDSQISTPTVIPKKRKASPTFSTQKPTGLVSKVGLLSAARRNIVFDSSCTPKASYHSKLPRSSTSSPSYITSSIPPTPIPQKLLHKSAKEKAISSRNLAGLRFVKKPEDLKMRLPRSMCDTGGRQSMDFIKLAGKSMEASDGFTDNKDERSDGEANEYVMEGENISDDGMVDVGWAF